MTKTVYNLTTGAELTFPDNIRSSYAVAYAYAEETGQLSRLLEVRRAYETAFPITRSLAELLQSAFPVRSEATTVSCGDWVCRI